MATLFPFICLQTLFSCVLIATSGQSTQLFGRCSSSAEDNSKLAADATADCLASTQTRSLASRLSAVAKVLSSQSEQSVFFRVSLSDTSRELTILRHDHETLDNKTSMDAEQTKRQMALNAIAIETSIRAIAINERNITDAINEVHNAQKAWNDSLASMLTHSQKTNEMLHNLIEWREHEATVRLRTLNDTLVLSLLEQGKLATDQKSAEQRMTTFEHRLEMNKVDASQLRHFVNDSVRLLDNRIDSIASDASSGYMEIKAGMEEVTGQLFSFGDVANRTVRGTVEEQGREIALINGSASLLRSDLNRLQRVVADAADYNAVKYVQMEDNVERQFEEYRRTASALENMTSWLELSLAATRNDVTRQGAVIRELMTSTEGWRREAAETSEMNVAMLNEHISELRGSVNMSLVSEGELRENAIRNASESLEKQLLLLQRSVNISQSEFNHYTREVVNNISRGCLQVYHNISEATDKKLLDLQGVFQSHLAVEIDARVGTLNDNVSTIIRQEREERIVAVQNVTAALEERFGQFSEAVSTSVNTTSAYIREAAISATRDCRKGYLDILERTDSQALTLRIAWTSGIEELNTTISTMIAENDVKLQNFRSDLRRLENGTERMGDEYRQSLSALQDTLNTVTSNVADNVTQLTAHLFAIQANANASYEVLKRDQEAAVADYRIYVADAAANLSAIMHRMDNLESARNTAARENTIAMEILNASLLARVDAFYQELVASAQEQNGQQRTSLNVVQSDISTLRANQDDMRRTARTQTDLDALATELIARVRALLTDCPQDWTTYNDSCYYFASYYVSWPEARLTCLALGGALVEIESDAENTFVGNQVAAKGFPVSWIGLHDQVTEGHWRWQSGKSVTYSKWATDEPNNTMNEDCVGIWASRGNGWNDNSCESDTHPFVCEKRGR